MAQVVVTASNNVSLTQLREAFVGATGALYGAGREYAKGLLASLGTAWLDMAHDQKGPEGDAMRAERDALYADLKKAGHANPSVKWKQLKDHARAIIAEQEKAERVAAGEAQGEEEGEGSGKAKHTRSPQLRYVEELTGLYKMGKREFNTLSDGQKRAHALIAGALAELGVDISML